MSSKAKKTPKHQPLYHKWVNFISKYGISLTDNMVHRRLTQVLDSPDGMTFMTEYRKLAGDIYHGSSLIRLRLMMFICNKFGFFNDKFKKDLNEYVTAFEDPN